MNNSRMNSTPRWVFVPLLICIAIYAAHSIHIQALISEPVSARLVFDDPNWANVATRNILHLVLVVAVGLVMLSCLHYSPWQDRREEIIWAELTIGSAYLLSQSMFGATVFIDARSDTMDLSSVLGLPLIFVRDVPILGVVFLHSLAALPHIILRDKTARRKGLTLQWSISSAYVFILWMATWTDVREVHGSLWR